MVLQIIVRTHHTPESYVAQHGEQEILPPSCCPACVTSGPLHRHDCYERYLSDLQGQFLVVIFLCPRCGVSVGCLPSFALSYRYIRVSTVAAFMNGRLEEPDVQRHLELLKRYQRDWEQWVPALAQRLGNRWGWSKGMPLAGLWKDLIDLYASLSEAARRLVLEFGVGVFRCYQVHAWARVPHRGMERTAWLAAFDSS